MRPPSSTTSSSPRTVAADCNTAAAGAREAPEILRGSIWRATRKIPGAMDPSSMIAQPWLPGYSRTLVIGFLASSLGFVALVLG